MMIVLMAALTSVTSIDATIRDQYYNKLVKEAGEAGMAMAQVCLKSNTYLPKWGSYNPSYVANDPTKQFALAPNTDCAGVENVNLSKYITGDNSNPKMTFSIDAPSTQGGGQKISSKGIVTRMRGSNASAVYQTYNGYSSAIIASQELFGSITMGSSFLYQDSNVTGAQFSLIKPDASVVSAGKNMDGRLGNGAAITTTPPFAADEPVPVPFILPASDNKARAVYSDIAGTGRYISVITTNGNVYTAGPNAAGELGNGISNATPQSTPVLFGKNISGGIKGKYVKPMNYQPYNSAATFVLTEDGRDIYVAGSCNGGALGIGNGAGKCSTSEQNDSTKVVDPVRVALPAYNASQPGTVIADNNWNSLGPDNFSMHLASFVRMQNGDVYGWGPNFTGLMGTGSYDVSTSASIASGGIVPTPIKVTAKKSSITPVASSVVGSGRVMYIIDTDGQAWAAGDNQFGGLMGASSYLKEMGYQRDCLAQGTGYGNPTKFYSTNSTNGPTGNTHGMIDCNVTSAYPTALFEIWPDGTWRLRKQATSTTRTDMSQFWCVTSPAASGQAITAVTCDSAMPANQQWMFATTPGQRTIKITKKIGVTDVCVQKAYWGNAVTVQNCTANNGDQEWELGRLTTPMPYLRPVPSLPGTKKFAKIVPGDSNVLVLDSEGEAWASGASVRGETCIGGGDGIRVSAGLKKIVFPSLPPGVKVVDIVVSQSQPEFKTNDGNQYNNTYFRMSNGTIYGCGANNFGQLGIGTQDTTTSYSTPTLMSKLVDMNVTAKDVQTGLGTTIILSTSGQIYAVGNNSNGQIGNPGIPKGSFTSTPVLNSYVTGVVPTLY
jgi:alpha-tubulin suppressor-like RCC1 family protein